MAKYVATDVLKIGFVTAALPGNVLEVSDEDIKKYGWEGKLKGAETRPAKASRGNDQAEA